MSVHAFIFPGQGCQSVGMGQALAAAFPAARETFQEVDDALGEHLFRVMVEGPGETLTRTEYAQPALLAHAIAVLRVIEREGNVRLAGTARLVAGHSLGEYAALAAAGAFTLGDAARLLRLRGRAMQDAVPEGEGAMAALLGCEMAAARAICGEAALLREPDGRETRQVIQPANDNGGGQVVISGALEAVERAIEISKAHGVRRAMLLPVSAPFHCALMAPAADAMATALERTRPVAPAVPLIANVTAAKATDPDEIARLLVEQVTATVRWRESVLAMAAMGVDSFCELGTGRVLSGLVRRILPDAQAIAAGTPGEVEAMLRVL